LQDQSFSKNSYKLTNIQTELKFVFMAIENGLKRKFIDIKINA